MNDASYRLANWGLIAQSKLWHLWRLEQAPKVGLRAGLFLIGQWLRYASPHGRITKKLGPKQLVTRPLMSIS